MVDGGVTEEVVDPSYYAGINEQFKAAEREIMADGELLAASCVVTQEVNR